MKILEELLDRINELKFTDWTFWQKKESGLSYRLE